LTTFVPGYTLNLVKLFRIPLASLLSEAGLPRRVGTRSEGERLRPVVLGLLEHCREPLVVLDLTGIELVNSSFSDEVLALPLQRLCGGEYGERFLAVLSPSTEVIQDAQLPLEKRDLTVMVFVGDALGGEWHLLGAQKSYFDVTLREIMRAGSLATGDLAKALDISLQNCSNRLTELAKRRLVQREREFGVRGGQTHANRSLLNLAV
jgi:hypothetical protein